LIEYATHDLPGKIESQVESGEFIEENLAHRLAEAGILPMYGMPTRVRALYYNRPGDHESEFKSVDRDLDLAITEFCPGARRIKDKRMLKPNGLIGSIFGSHSYKSGLPVPYRRYHKFCQVCNRLEEEVDRDALSEGPCDDCASEKTKIYPVLVPAAFRTDGFGDKDAPDGDGVGASGRAVVAAITNRSSGEEKHRGNAHLALSREGRIFRINNNEEKLYQFKVVDDEGANVRMIGSRKIGGESHWIEFEDWKRQNGEPGEGVEADEVGALVAPKTTDLLRIKPGGVAGLDLNPVRGTRLKAAFQSAATILVQAVASRQDIDPEEIEIASIKGSWDQDRRATGEILLVDRLPNGAGFVEWLYDRWDEVLAELLGAGGHKRAPKMPCKCDSGCYNCLFSYRNRPLHGLLDWRLGHDLLHALHRQDFMCGLDGRFEGVALDQWVQRAGADANRMCERFEQATKVEGCALPGFEIEGKVYLVAHPLWSHEQSPDSIVGQAAEALGGQVRLMNSFDLSRRMAWCWQNKDEEALFPVVDTGGEEGRPYLQEKKVLAIPAGDSFTLEDRPRGLPAGAEPVFQGIGENDEVKVGAKYLCRANNGEYIVGRINRIEDYWRVVPANHCSSAQAFEAGREDIVATLGSMG
jgi:hypothetical protein